MLELLLLLLQPVRALVRAFVRPVAAAEELPLLALRQRLGLQKQVWNGWQFSKARAADPS